MKSRNLAKSPKATAKTQKSEFLANRLFMLISSLLVLLSVAAFLWLAGVLEWRGSAGDNSIEVDLQCGNPAPKAISSIAFVDFENDTVEIDVVSDTDGWDHDCPNTKIRSSRMPRALVSAGTVDAPGGDAEIPAKFSPVALGGAPPIPEAVIPTVKRLRLDFRHGELLQYVGLGERDFSLELKIYLAQRSSFWISPQSLRLQVRPPQGFFLVSSLPSASLSPNDIWTMDLSAYDQSVEATFKDDKLSRLDHIIDSSIAALLGVGAGGIMSAWLALRLTRSSQ